jgi:uncharacterized SAM-binding protein YcdF (DUF218 family)
MPVFSFNIKQKKSIRNFAKIEFTFSIFILLILPISCTVISPVRKSPYKTFVSNCVSKPFDVIIVPGIPYNGVSWNSIMKQRVYWSKFLFDNGYASNIIYSGGAVYTPYIESRIMALYAEALGIPKDHIFTEEKAEHTTENVYYSYYLAKEKGFKNIALATDPYQTNNLHSFLKKYKLEIKVLPIQYDTMYVMARNEPKINSTWALADTASFVSIKNRESFIKRLKGTMGKNIDFTEEDRIK